MLCYYVIDVRDSRVVRETLIQPFVWLGMNPLFVFVMMVFSENLFLTNIKFTYDGTTGYSLWNFINNVILNSWIHNLWVTSLLYAVLGFVFWTFVAWLLFRKNIFIKL